MNKCIVFFFYNVQSTCVHNTSGNSARGVFLIKKAHLILTLFVEGVRIPTVCIVVFACHNSSLTLNITIEEAAVKFYMLGATSAATLLYC